MPLTLVGLIPPTGLSLYRDNWIQKFPQAEINAQRLKTTQMSSPSTPVQQFIGALHHCWSLGCILKRHDSTLPGQEASISHLPHPKWYCSFYQEFNFEMENSYFEDNIVKEKFAMITPDVQIEDGKGTILISSEEGETEANNHKKLSEFGIRNRSQLQADDFLQDYTLLINILHSEDLGKDVEFEVVGDAPEKVGPKQVEDAAKSITNGSDDGAQPSTSTAQEQDDVLIVDSDEDGPSNNADISSERNRKRKLDELYSCQEQ
ncbi:SUMO-activating enzyme subunit 2-like [Erinaceus europaeus]|uniref:SUMO-activating enzyme subunit 2-like n=1 Tax=Erinaceus europaeus TaxID=9365 RepID=A0ABM3VVF6_ERIEU|nr:SUMO-activating enzyme subunit 2-like [Erinaceus europaeus]